MRERYALPPAGPGATCRYGDAPTDRRRPDGVAFANSTAGHVGCCEEAEIARLLAAGQRAVAGVTATTDEGEMFHAGDEP